MRRPCVTFLTEFKWEWQRFWDFGEFAKVLEVTCRGQLSFSKTKDILDIIIRDPLSLVLISIILQGIVICSFKRFVYNKITL